MLVTNKRTLLPFEDGGAIEGPVQKRFRGLSTPPASPEKKQENAQPPAPRLKGTRRLEQDDEVAPRRLVFGKDSVYLKAKSLLQRSSLLSPKHPWLPTREAQYREISAFLRETIGSSGGNSLYITGPPGTGKTAQLELAVRQGFHTILIGEENRRNAPKHDPALANTMYYELGPGKYQSVAMVSLNCIALRRPESLWSKIHEQLGKNAAGDAVKSMDDLQGFFKSYPNTAFVVILDEIDKLLTSTLEDSNATKIIVDLFLLARLPSVRFTLIGIANSLDMKDRFLNRLLLSPEFLPKVINFAPYTSEEMFEIVTSKLKSVDKVDTIIQPMAIKFAAKKCSSNTGDLRKLFDVLRNSIELAELESLRRKDNGPPVRVTLTHVSKVFSTYMNSSSTKTRISKLNLQQKIVLCALVHREKSDLFQTQCTIDDAYDYYTKLLSDTIALNPLNRNEFLESCDTLEMYGVASIENGKHGKKAKQLVKLIKSTVDEKEFHDEICKMDLLKKLII
ncbi:AaceriAFR621Cp [[Ashbya] aceris (nom. inval.)]|nr:AaceriAFR621Cp [[Ashbya] aceris (nom. inval.)]